LPTRSRKSVYLRLFGVAYVALLFIAPGTSASVSAADDPLGAAVEAARKTHDEKQLQSLKAQLEQMIAQNPNDLGIYLELARVHEYFLDVYDMRKDKKAAGEAVYKAIDAAQRSIQLNDKSADAHFKILLLRASKTDANLFLSETLRRRVVDLTDTIALAAASLSIDYNCRWRMPLSMRRLRRTRRS